MNQPVFPSQYLLPENQGMSLRDYFAAQAMQIYMKDQDLLECFFDLCERGENKNFKQMVADTAYEMADAMLLARQA